MPRGAGNGCGNCSRRSIATNDSVSEGKSEHQQSNLLVCQQQHKGEKTRMNLKEKFGLTRYALLFLALLIPVVAGKLAAAEDQPGADSALVIDVYSGAVAPDATQEKSFWLW